jgi:hypothetical protein
MLKFSVDSVLCLKWLASDQAQDLIARDYGSPGVVVRVPDRAADGVGTQAHTRSRTSSTVGF